MITEHDLREAIAECQGQKNPNANTCIKLAAFYTIKQHLYPEERQQIEPPAYSYAGKPAGTVIDLDSGSDFASAVNGREVTAILPIIDELMETLRVVYPRLYDAVMVKIEGS